MTLQLGLEMSWPKLLPMEGRRWPEICSYHCRALGTNGVIYLLYEAGKFFSFGQWCGAESQSFLCTTFQYSSFIPGLPVLLPRLTSPASFLTLPLPFPWFSSGWDSWCLDMLRVAEGVLLSSDYFLFTLPWDKPALRASSMSLRRNKGCCNHKSLVPPPESCSANSGREIKRHHYHSVSGWHVNYGTRCAREGYFHLMPPHQPSSCKARQKWKRSNGKKIQWQVSPWNKVCVTSGWGRGAAEAASPGCWAIALL